MRAGRCALQLLASFFGLLLQFFLQLLLCFFEHLRIRGRTVIGLGEIVQRQREADRLAVAVDRLHGELLALLQAADDVGIHFVVGHAAIGEADDIRTGGRLALVDDHARAGRHLHAERQRDAKEFLVGAFRLDHDGGDDRQAGFKTAVLAGKADLLGIRLLPLQAELGPGRIDQGRLFCRRGGLLLCGSGRLRGLARLRRRCAGLAAGAAGFAAGAAGCCAMTGDASRTAKAAAVNVASVRLTGRADADAFG